MQASNIEMFKKATLASWNMQICQVLLDVQVSIFASWDRQASNQVFSSSWLVQASYLPLCHCQQGKNPLHQFLNHDKGK